MARQQKEPAPPPDRFHGTTKEREPCLKAIVWLVWEGLAKAAPNQLELAVGTIRTAGALRGLEIGPDAMARQQNQPAPPPDLFNGTTKEREPCLKAIVWLVWKGLAKAAPNQLAVGTRYVQLDLSETRQ